MSRPFHEQLAELVVQQAEEIAATTAKHGIDGLDALTRLATGKPWLPAATR